MNRLYDYDNPAMGFIGTLCDLILLNLLFLISCLPIITIGASVTALHYVTLKIARKEAPAIWASFWKSFRENFKAATLIWLVILLVAVLLIFDYWASPVLMPAFAGVMRPVILVLALLFFCIVIYIFPILSRFVCTGKQAVKNALLMAFGHFPQTMLLLVIYGFFPLLCLISSNLFLTISSLFLICGFSVMALAAGKVFDKLFSSYEVRYDL